MLSFMTMFVFYRTSTRAGRLDMLDNGMACITWTIQICPQTKKITPFFSLIQQRPKWRRSSYRCFDNFQCQICLKYGHTSLALYDHTTRQPLHFSSPSPPMNTIVATASSTIAPTHPNATVASATTSAHSTTWILDSGASFHVTNDS